MKGSIGTSCKLHHLLYGTAVYNRQSMAISKSISKFSQSDPAKFRLQVLDYGKEYGLKAAIAAFGVSRPTILRWKKIFKRSKGQLSSLVPKSRAPKQRRTPTTDNNLVTFIKHTREEHDSLGKEKIKPLLDEYCEKKHLKSISISTIGRTIKRHNLGKRAPIRIYHNPDSGHANRQISFKSRVKHSPGIKHLSASEGYLEIDTITRFTYGLKLYVFNAVDIKLKFQFSYSYDHLSSRNGVHFLQKLREVYPLETGIKTIQTDNGLEFHGEFEQYLTREGIKHLFTYPRCPRINGFVERANRTLSEEFLNSHLEYASNLDIFNRKLIDYLIWYNTKRVHKALGNLSPIDYLLKVSPKSHMYWTHTND